MTASRRPSVVIQPPVPSSSASAAQHPSPPPLAWPRPQPRPRPQHPHSLTPPQTQPTPVTLNPSALRSLFYRLTHPPAPPPSIAVTNEKDKGKGKERARWWQGWKIQPEYEVRLEDVLDRKHLPPLGLKDFEEWLLFVEGSAENLYFILWLREYTTRYTAWTTALRNKRSLHLSSSQPSPLTTATSQQQRASRSRQPKRSESHHSNARVIQSERERPFTSISLALSSLSLSPPHSPDTPTSRLNYPSFGSQGSPQVSRVHLSSQHGSVDNHDDDAILENTDSDDDSARRSSHQRKRTYRTHWHSPSRPPPNPTLAMFYLRAKETFLTPNADYELDVCSDVLAVFHTSARKADEEDGGMYVRPGRRDSGVEMRDARDVGGFEYVERECWPRSTSDMGASVFGGGLKTSGGLPGAAMYPPDPAVFAELAEIVEGRLRESLARLVVATYNNVGTPRAYCGSAGGCVIGLVTSVPPLAASFSTGGSRWFRLLALPGMWLGLTIFISAFYGVCMMIYIFGDLRQLRSFELARPPISQPKPLLHESPRPTHLTHQQLLLTSSASPSTGGHPSRSAFGHGLLGALIRKKAGSGVGYAGGTGQRGQSEDFHAMYRKESLQPVAHVEPVFPPARRPSVAQVQEMREREREQREYERERGREREKEKEMGKMRARERESPRSSLKESMKGRVDRERRVEKPKPALRVNTSRNMGSRWSEDSEGDARADVAEEGGEDVLVVVPPKAVIRPRRVEADAPSVDLSCYSDSVHSGSECGSDDESMGSDDDEHERDSDLGDDDDISYRPRRRSRGTPRIEISDAFYDEHPSPEGPATAPADWFPGNLERLAAQNPLPVPSSARSNTHSLPYAHAQQRQHGSTTTTSNPLWPDYADPDAHDMRTALFIGPFLYDQAQRGGAYAYAQEDYTRAKGKGDVEKGLDEEDVAAHQPMDQFDFDGLPPRRGSPRANANSNSGSKHMHMHMQSSHKRDHRASGGSWTLRQHQHHQHERTLSETRREVAGADQARSSSPSLSLSSNGKPSRWWWRLVEAVQVKCGPENMVDVLERREKEGERREKIRMRSTRRAGADNVDVERGQEDKERWQPSLSLPPAYAQIPRSRQQTRSFEELDVREVRAHAVSTIPFASSPPATNVIPPISATSGKTEKPKSKARTSWRAGLRKVYLAVPAFASPLTPVLNPLVGRAQWEIVVRSAAVSFLISCLVVGGLVGVPQT